MASGLTFTAIAASPGGYLQSDLVSDEPGVAHFTDANLVNPWGFLAGAGGHLVVADNHAGVVTFYNPAGQPAPLTIAIPAPDGGSGGAVTDLALNHSPRSFGIGSGERKGESTLLFVTEDGTIAAWNHELSPDQALIAVDNSGAGAIYKSVALAATHQGPRLYAANFGQGVVETAEPGKITVFFASGRRVLVQSKEGSTGGGGLSRPKPFDHSNTAGGKPVGES